jgi:hypothetical protein
MLASGNLGSATLNHQMWPRAINRSNPYRRFADTPYLDSNLICNGRKQTQAAQQLPLTEEVTL